MSHSEEAKPIQRVPVREGYDLWAEHYDRTANPVVAMDERFTLPLLAPRRGERILDAGCGTGRNLVRLVAAGALVRGMDFSPGMLQVAARRVPGVELQVADLHQRLSFDDASFDAVLCALIGEHLDELDTCAREFRRLLVPGGRLVFSVYHPAMAEAGKEANFERDGVEYRLGAVWHTLADYERALTAAGFTGLERHERAGDEELARQLPSARRYLGFPLLLVLVARRT